MNDSFASGPVIVDLDCKEHSWAAAMNRYTS